MRARSVLAVLLALATLALVGCDGAIPQPAQTVTVSVSATESATLRQFASAAAILTVAGLQFQRDLTSCPDRLTEDAAVRCASFAHAAYQQAESALVDFADLGRPPSEIDHLLNSTQLWLRSIAVTDPSVDCADHAQSAMCQSDVATVKGSLGQLIIQLAGWEPYL
jgi:hypothetical protein